MARVCGCDAPHELTMFRWRGVDDVNLRTLSGACTVRSHGDTHPKGDSQTRLRARHARTRGAGRTVGTRRVTPRGIAGRIRARRHADPVLPDGPEGCGAESRNFAQEG